MIQDVKKGFLDWILIQKIKKGFLDFESHPSSWFSWCSIRLHQEDSRKKMEESRSVLDSRNQESVSWLKVLDPQEEFLVLELFKKRVKNQPSLYSRN